jgi:hypothetical protein
MLKTLIFRRQNVRNTIRTNIRIFIYQSLTIICFTNNMRTSSTNSTCQPFMILIEFFIFCVNIITIWTKLILMISNYSGKNEEKRFVLKKVENKKKKKKKFNSQKFKKRKLTSIHMHYKENNFFLKMQATILFSTIK